VTYEVRTAEYVVSTDPSRLDIDAVHTFLSERSYWAAGISRERFETALGNSLPFGLYRDERLLAFTRVITDFVTFAYLADVFVLEPFRRQGLSKLLLRAVFEHPRLQHLRRWMLGTRDAHDLYRQFGFMPLGEPQRWMELPDATAYDTRQVAAS
jgi:GNAT superfamily N-acetyltransferase